MYKFIELVSSKDLYVLMNTGKFHERMSVWEILKYKPRGQSRSKIGDVDPNNNSDLNDLVHGIRDYKINSDDPLVLCFDLPDEELGQFIDGIEELKKQTRDSKTILTIGESRKRKRKLSRYNIKLTP